jgi:Txe/YoeB family toxin of Txe-Axe toxin-antitoxin module
MNISVEILSIIASIVSVILAIVAIGLAVAFFWISNRIANDIKEASYKIDSSVNRLETLFDKLYSGMFAMVDDTMKDMREKVFKAPESSDDKLTEEIEEKMNSFKKDVSSEISGIIKRQAGTEGKMDNIISEVNKTINRVIDKSAKLKEETEENYLRRKILDTINILKSNKEKVNYMTIAGASGEETKKIGLEIFKMGEENILSWRQGGSATFPSNLSSRAEIKIVDKKR